jgi:hypothetical protein
MMSAERGTVKKETLEKSVSALFVLWFFLLVPWLPLAMVSLMAFDAGPTFGVYLFVWSIWTYPVSVGIAWLFRSRVIVAPLLPFVNIVFCLVSGQVG